MRVKKKTPLSNKNINNRHLLLQEINKTIA